MSLLLRIREPRDQQAWQMFVDLYMPLVYGYCRTRGVQDADAADVVQEVFTRVSRGIRGFDYDPQRGGFRNWLGTLTWREMQRHLQKVRRTGRGVGGDAGAAEINRLEGELDLAWVEEFNAQVCRSALERIRPEFDDAVWQAFELTWVQDCKPNAAAEQVGRTTDWVYKARYLVLQRLREEIQFLAEDVIDFARP